MRWFKRALIGLLALLAIPLLYSLAAVIGGLISVNSGWKEPERGVAIFVETNGVHTWITVPKVTSTFDWRRLARPEHVKDPRYGRGDYVAIGFGNRDFYLNTPTWGDLSPRTAAAALAGGGPSLMHVFHAWRPRADEHRKRLLVRPAEYRRLLRYLLASFDYRDGRWMLVAGRGYGGSDAFYDSRRDYHWRRTCNEWTGEALRAAGVRTGAWTPLSQSIMSRLPDG